MRSRPWKKRVHLEQRLGMGWVLRDKPDGKLLNWRGEVAYIGQNFALFNFRRQALAFCAQLDLDVGQDVRDEAAKDRLAGVSP